MAEKRNLFHRSKNGPRLILNCLAFELSFFVHSIMANPSRVLDAWVLSLSQSFADFHAAVQSRNQPIDAPAVLPLPPLSREDVAEYFQALKEPQDFKSVLKTVIKSERRPDFTDIINMESPEMESKHRAHLMASKVSEMLIQEFRKSIWSYLAQRALLKNNGYRCAEYLRFLFWALLKSNPAEECLNAARIVLWERALVSTQEPLPNELRCVNRMVADLIMRWLLGETQDVHQPLPLLDDDKRLQLYDAFIAYYSNPTTPFIYGPLLLGGKWVRKCFPDHESKCVIEDGKKRKPESNVYVQMLNNLLVSE